MNDSGLIMRWKEASKDLGIEIVVPFELDIDGSRIKASLLVLGFGGENGTIIVTQYAIVKHHISTLSALNYGFAVLDEPNEGSHYDREMFIDMLSEWEWCGTEALRPKWLK